MTNQQNGRAVAIAPDDVGRSLLSQLTPQEREILTKRIAVGASEIECELFLRQAKSEGLNPWAMPPEVWLIPRRQQVNGQWVTQYVPQTGKDGALKRAKQRGVYRTHQLEHRVGGQWYADGDEPDDAQHPDRTRCTMPVGDTGLSVSAVVRWSERAQYTREGRLTETWQRMPFEMLAKCAIVAALKLLPDTEGVDIAEEEWDDEGVSRRAFWAWADEQGFPEPIVRRALQVPEGQSLGAAVERMGGWNKARVYVERYAPTILSLPADLPRPSVDDLYNEPIDPVAAARAAQADMVDPLTGEIRDATPAAESDEPHEASEEETTDLHNEPITVGACEVCEEPVIDTGSGVLRCDLHGGDAGEGSIPPMPDSVKDLSTFIAAAGALPPEGLGCSRADISLLGKLNWRNTSPDEHAARWDELGQKMAAKRAQEPALPLGEG